MSAAVNVVTGGVTTAYSTPMYLPCGAFVTLNLTSPSSPVASFVDVTSRSGGFQPHSSLGTGTSYSLTLPPVPDDVTITFTAYGTAPFANPQTVTILLRARHAVAVQEFGAVGDGSTDDSAAFNNAYTALSGTGLPMIVPSATYSIVASAIVNGGGVNVIMGPGAAFTGANASSAQSATARFVARNLVTSLAAYGGSGTATLTASSNGAWATQDGVTNAVGDTVFIQGGTANLTAAKDTGPWVIASLGGASAKWVLVRPGWWSNGSTFLSGMAVDLGGEGTLAAATRWKVTAASGVVGTNDPGFYVMEITFQITLASGTKALSAGTGGLAGNNVPVGVLSASRSAVSCSLSALGGTNTGTVSFGAKALTPGYMGTSAFSLFAFATAMATQASDASVINVTLVNGS